MDGLAAMVLAGGRGVRMRSAGTKMLMPILGKPLVMFPLELALSSTAGPVVVVAGDTLEEIRRVIGPGLPGERMRWALQEQPLGSGDAVRAGTAAVEACEHLLILNGDGPVVSAELIQKLIRTYGDEEADIVFVGCKPSDPTGYGRVLYDDSGVILGIKEERELEAHERELKLVNAGIYLVSYPLVQQFVEGMTLAPRQKEFLLTDLVSFIVGQGGKAQVVVTPDPGEVAGVNNRAELAAAWARIRAVRNRQLMLEGVSMYHSESVDVDFGVEVGPDTVIEGEARLAGRTRVGRGCRIGSGCVVEDTTIEDDVRLHPHCVLESAVVATGCSVGPFAHLRPGAVLEAGAKVGNFVELKKTVLGEGSKANHLSYLGDASIGKKVNVGAGTITCNYDGYKKYRTVIEDGVFIGSDTQLVAPVKLGKECVVAAGTTVTEDVPEGALAISRPMQKNIPGYTERKKSKVKSQK